MYRSPNSFNLLRRPSELTGTGTPLAPQGTVAVKPRQEFIAIISFLDANEVLEGPHLSIRTRTRGALLKGPGLLQLVLELLELSPQLRVF